MNIMIDIVLKKKKCPLTMVGIIHIIKDASVVLNLYIYLHKNGLE